MKKKTTHDPASPKVKNDAYVLRLYVAGLGARSSTAIRNIRQLCETHLDSRYDLQVIDICERPAIARERQIVAAPTLVKQLPLPPRRLIGDMSDEQRVLEGLDLKVGSA